MWSFPLGSTQARNDVILDTGYKIERESPIAMHPIEFGDNDSVSCSSDQFVSIFDLISGKRISFAKKNSESDGHKLFNGASFFKKKKDSYHSILEGQIGTFLQSEKNKCE